MELSLALILDELGLEADSYLPGGSNPKFSSVELYTAGEKPPAGSKLLVCALSEAVAADKPEGAFFLCVRDGPVDLSVSGRMLEGITVVRGSHELHVLFNRVLRVFVKVAEWVMAMERSSARRLGLQELIDLSEPVFNNFITIQDSTFKLIAYTKNIKPPGIVMSRLVQHGFHPPETVELLRRNRRVEEYKTIPEVIVSRDKITSEFDVVKKAFHLGGSMLILVVMECCGKPADNATIELFGILIEYIQAYADLDIAQTGGVGGVKSLVLDILNNSAGSKEDARVRSTYCGYPFEGGFRLYVFTFEDEDNVPVAHVISLLTKTCGDAVAFSREANVLLLEFERADAGKTCEKAEAALSKTDFICGISNRFGSLWDLPAAFEQASIASDISGRLTAMGKNGNTGRFRRFSDHMLYHMISSGHLAAPQAYENSFLKSSIAMLRKYDEEHRTETARMLRTYLENDRSATATASVMHMHRNTILYHMEKISDLLGVSLNDSDTRLLLLLAFKAEELIHM